jgi:tRNA threonylcarbamoyladenosine biosynthesis protein TsaB
VRVVALDTSTTVTSCALVEDENVLWEKELLEKAGDVLPAALGDLSAVDAVAVGLGPGSFTGLRVGLAAAKALSYARKLPIAGVSSLLALAHGQEGLVCAATDARKGELFAQFFRDGIPQGEVRVVFGDALELGEARLVHATPKASVIARLCLPELRGARYEAEKCFALAPDYRQGFANLT